MSDKRFSFGAVSPNVAMIKDNGEVMDIGEVVDLLNELAEENNILNKNEDDLKECIIENIKLKEENEQLKHYKLYEDNKRLQTIIADLKKENEQLKHINDQLEERLESSGIGITLKMDCEKYE